MIKHELIRSEILDEEMQLRFEELCQICCVEAEFIIEMVNYGLLEPKGHPKKEWYFSGPAIARINTVIRLQRDLEVNLPGAAVIVELMEELEQLRRKIAWFENHL